MRKIAALVTILTLLGALTPALAYTDIRMYLDANGETSLNELATVSGFDYSEPCFGDWEVTAYVHEGIENDGSLTVVKQVVNPGEWELVEAKNVFGSGETEIVKDVGWWTEDSHRTCGGLEMRYPTVANIFVGFYTDTMTDQEEIHNTANLPVETPVWDDSGEYSASRFLKNIYTTDDFAYEEGVGINLDFDCLPKQPEPIDPPFCPHCDP